MHATYKVRVFDKGGTKQGGSVNQMIKRRSLPDLPTS